MLLDAAAEMKLDLARSFLIGDSISDLQAAKNAGVQGILVHTGRGREAAQHLEPNESDVWPVADLTAAVELILNNDREHTP
jgi:D-glycero-D-manno-heptose 1,7-bisphosphate phosphatase